MWPKENTAFLVIHGTGAHKPFWQLDLFVRNFWKYFESENDTSKIEWKHKLLSHNEEGWIESYISFKQENETKSKKLDFYEYYWDIYMSGTSGINIGDLGNLLKVASDGAKAFYKKRPRLSRKYEIEGVPLFKGGDFISDGYLKIFRYFNFIVKMFSWLPINSQLIKSLVSEALKYFINIMADFLIYLNPDVRADYYAIRQKILKGAVEEVIAIIESNNDYKQIIIVAHSLGSAIAYDALNLINRDINIDKNIANKISGLVTLGSPLDKVAFFLNEHPESKEFIRKQLLEQIHGFKKEESEDQGYPIISSFPPCLDEKKIKWLNFYHMADMVSSKLDWYNFDEEDNRNILCNYRAKSISDAHTYYWKYPQMYEEIANTFFK